MREKVHIAGLKNPPTISCVIITRDRPHLLRQTLASLGKSLYPLQAVIVSDDSTEEATAQMLRADFPEVTRLEGPRRGRAANRNHAIHAATADCILVSDDDMLIDPEFCRTALEKVSQDGCSLVFPSMREDEHVFMPNALDFLGFLTKAYAAKTPYHTAHSGCFLLSRAIAEQVTYDETIESYGYEEVDFIYRVASAAFQIGSVPECVALTSRRIELIFHQRKQTGSTERSSGTITSISTLGKVSHSFVLLSPITSSPPSSVKAGKALQMPGRMCSVSSACCDERGDRAHCNRPAYMLPEPSLLRS